ncbi:hypothetical protein [Domibacillus tundrae]|uniref:hypothetical protein n=1 Tax=Domibacillus tundrae TaxID=1587527 RepID=UPI0012E06564|nr:hypothetical protein [Domibacillus tundrae]
MEHPEIVQIMHTGYPLMDKPSEDESFIEVNDLCEECQARKKASGSDYCIVCLEA